MLEKLKSIGTNMSDGLFKYAFVLSTGLVAALYFLYERQGRTLRDTQADIQKARLEAQLAEIRSRSSIDEYEYKKAKDDFDRLRARHGDLMRSLGIDPETSGSESNTDN